jgi:F0F1-type ATP synthase delta subunit
MNTENNTAPVAVQTKKFLDMILKELDALTVASRTETTLNELQVCIERITFHLTAHPQDTTISPDILVQLLQTDVSKEMQQFIEWAVSHGFVKLFIGNVGRAFLSYCSRYYRGMPEIIVQTPVPISESFSTILTQELRAAHPYPARIIFQTERSLIVGCVITTPQRTYDYSVRRTMTSNIALYVKASMRRPIGVVHG